MMGNHIIKAARCALLPASQHIKTAASHGIQKRKKKKTSKSEKIKSETDRKQPSGTGLTSSLTPDCHRKTISPQIKNICSHFSTLRQHNKLAFLTSLSARTRSFDERRAAVISSLLSVLNYYVIFVLC